MRRFILAAVILLIAAPMFAAGPENLPKPVKKAEPVKSVKKRVKAKELKLRTEEQKTLYAVGLVMARQLASFELTPAELRIVRLGLTDGIRGRKSRVDFTKYSKKSQELGIARRDAAGKKLEAKAADFIEAAAQVPGAVKTKSGAIYLSLREGAGAQPVETDTVKLDFRNTLIDGKEMDNTYKNGAPESAKANEFLKCLTEGVLLMKTGGKARLVCPPDTALGKESFGLIPPNATLVYEVELLEIVKDSNVVKGAKPE